LNALQQQSQGAGGEGEKAGAKGRPGISGTKAGAGAGVNPVFTLKNAVPAESVKAAAPAIIDRLKTNGAVVLPVNASSNYLSVNFVTVGKQVPDSLLELLADIREQLIWLKLDEVELTSAGYAAIGKLDKLTRLQISRANLSDETIGALSGLKNLQWLNIAGSNVSIEGLRKLSSLSGLQQLFLYKGSLNSADWSALQQLFPKVQIDTGNYRLPLLPGDTSLVK
jgi:hypothetical protein